jgi:sec-independent protein translocase protein TatB
MAYMLFIVLLALIFLGPRKLPQLAREVGRIFAELRRAKDEFAGQFQREIGNLDQAPVGPSLTKLAEPPPDWSNGAKNA